MPIPLAQSLPSSGFLPARYAPKTCNAGATTSTLVRTVAPRAAIAPWLVVENVDAVPALRVPFLAAAPGVPNAAPVPLEVRASVRL